MKLYCAHTFLPVAVKVALLEQDVEYVHVPKPTDYGQFFRQRWEEGESFINIEHDIIPWPGAIEDLAVCGRWWCGYNYHLKRHTDLNFDAVVNVGDREVRNAAPLGCAKISAQLIEATPGLWDDPVTWTACDGQLTRAADEARIRWHQHFPGVVNANPRFLHQ